MQANWQNLIFIKWPTLPDGVMEHLKAKRPDASFLLPMGPYWYQHICHFGDPWVSFGPYWYGV